MYISIDILERGNIILIKPIRKNFMGTEFNGLFDEWAHTYDSFVQGEDIQYKVFAHYEDILEDVVNKSFGNVLEFGVGTGNLTNKLLLAGRTVYGIEPSREMRMIAKENCQKNFQLQTVIFFRLKFQIQLIPL